MSSLSSLARPRRPAGPGVWDPRAEKIQPWHRDRLAVVYVRQSRPQQVVDHQESTRLQYGLRQRAQELGWAPDRVLVIDEDLGVSGATTAGRAGFARLVAEVSLDHVGLILGLEMSRLARSCADWYPLLELCALFGTLLADLDGVYDPGQYNDRLLLGLKGTMSEAELHLLKQRMQQGKLSKARRGELAFPLPTGYVRSLSGEVAFDPDEQVQQVVRLIFRQFEELGTLNGVLQYLVQHEIQIGVRLQTRAQRGDLVWRRPKRTMLQHILKHPIYAGAYAYGRRQVDPRRQQPGRPKTGSVVVGRGEWLVLLRERGPAYLSWEQYERNVGRLVANQARADTVGTPRRGGALLTGLVVCAKCGARMTVAYHLAEHPSYRCTRQLIEYGGAACQAVAAAGLDAWISQQVLAALQPAPLELSLGAAEHLEQERAELDRLWQQRLERARYEAQRVERQYRLAEPENRLVVRHLEREWNDQLTALEQLDDEYARFQRTQPRHLTADERAAIRRLAADIPALWQAPTTTVAERKEILRQVVQRVLVDAQGQSERVQVTVEWVGGARSEADLIRPVGKLAQLSYYPQLLERVRSLAAAGRSDREIADRLNAEGYRPPKRRERFGAAGVSGLLRGLGLRPERSRSQARDGLDPHEWWLPALAQELGIPDTTLYLWARGGSVRARQQDPPLRRWIIWADPDERERLRQRHQQRPGDRLRRRWRAEAATLGSEPTGSPLPEQCGGKDRS